MIRLDYSHALLKENINDYQARVDAIHQTIINKTAKGNDYLGWVDWPVNYDREEFRRVKEVAKEIR
ncbi:MAG TPA: glucose-6-phosphate isomerase, partial [Erysipelotrichaceae bacterium]|nr:glucose-6-phosphate isomerase [Erysipelotrichaceae bacterium]